MLLYQFYAINKNKFARNGNTSTHMHKDDFYVNFHIEMNNLQIHLRDYEFQPKEEDVQGSSVKRVYVPKQHQHQ